MTDQHDLSEEERKQYEAEWEQLDEKVILAQILTELQQIRLILSDPNTQDNEDEDEPRFECTKCGTVVPEGERERHATEQHRAPAGMTDTLFEDV